MTGEPSRESFARYRDLMAAHGFRPSKKLGQNFLLDPSLHRTIAAAVDITASDLVLEVGPGLGFLTRELAARAGHVVAVEIDERLAAILRADLSASIDSGKVTLVVGDALERGGLSPAVCAALADARGFERLLVVANLPYTVVGPLLAALVGMDPRPADAMALLVQLELGERLAARCGGRPYGGLSATVQSVYDVELLRRVGPGVFRPRPRVDSGLVRLTRRAAGAALAPAAERRAFARFVRELFAQRRKTLRHGLERVRRAFALGEVPAREPGFAARRAEGVAPDELWALWRAWNPLDSSSP